MIATETLAKPARKPLPDEAPHILVVDDDRRLRELLGRFLGDNGYRVTTAANAAEADTRLGNLVFDAIVLDVMMPGENGFDFARRFRGGSAVPMEQARKLRGLLKETEGPILAFCASGARCAGLYQMAEQIGG